MRIRILTFIHILRSLPFFHIKPHLNSLPLARVHRTLWLPASGSEVFCPVECPATHKQVIARAPLHFRPRWPLPLLSRRRSGPLLLVASLLPSASNWPPLVATTRRATCHHQKVRLGLPAQNPNVVALTQSSPSAPRHIQNLTPPRNGAALRYGRHLTSPWRCQPHLQGPTLGLPGSAPRDAARLF
jgi:hypothetical protein